MFILFYTFGKEIMNEVANFIDRNFKYQLSQRHCRIELKEMNIKNNINLKFRLG